jgi:hypothetical protein
VQRFPLNGSLSGVVLLLLLLPLDHRGGGWNQAEDNASG